MTNRTNRSKEMGRIALLVVVSVALAGGMTGCKGRPVGNSVSGDGSVYDSGSREDGSLPPDGGHGDGAAQDSGPGDAGQTCGDPDVLARYSECLAADTEETCEAAGGTWDTIGLAPYESCQCPTGQGGCPCTRTQDCLSSCVAEMEPMWDCDGVTVGHCSSVSITVGCWCLFDEDGHVEGWCID